ncbi:class II glutamine amidotransferase [Algibacillus agarilyticus]|uniref:class II glutamine amidotransferase n=1 Tax=Algibacillus agarilyticus TaxID=2234133 RepID=UPI000DD0DACC|nr:class II glutamine amidotransferase [Algibacillus agarilyticus]
MCRFFAYSGPEILMDELLHNACNSLIKQSKSAQKTHLPVNGDGFGIGWYPTHDDPEPGTFVSVDPAWSNKNLLQLASKLKSSHFFAHVRDASGGLSVSLQNCHPFQHGRYLWMHNGLLDEFDLYRRDLLAQLNDTLFNAIQGSTDSEYAFALYLHNLAQQVERFAGESVDAMQSALLACIKQIMQLRNNKGAHRNAFMNFAVTNGEDTLVTRFSSDENTQPSSLFYAKGQLRRCGQGLLCIENNQNTDEHAIIIASEPLTQDRENWIKVERNHMVIARANQTVKTMAIPLPYQRDL